jgi:hypothetical protein
MDRMEGIFLLSCHCLLTIVSDTALLGAKDFLMKGSQLDVILIVCQTRQWCFDNCCGIGLGVAEFYNQADYQRAVDEFKKFKPTLAYTVLAGIFHKSCVTSKLNFNS